VAVPQRTEPGELARLPRRPFEWSEVPWTWIIILALGVLVVYAIVANPAYQDAFLFLREGMRVTITVSLISFAIALVLGLIAGFGRVSKNALFYTISTFYVEVVRGIPMLILLIYFAYVVTPLLLQGAVGLGNLLTGTSLNSLGVKLAAINIQDVNMEARAVAGLSFGYGAFLAEIYRAGFLAIDRGQMEAARSLGMNYMQSMRFIILPQAIRKVLPPIGNDFISMLKDSSLLSALAVRELTQLGKLNRARTFSTFETWNTVAFLYLSMTLLLSLLVRTMERRLRVER
jgi:polar amino acid transport system permease protein